MSIGAFILPFPTEIQFLIFKFEHKYYYKPVLQELSDKKCKDCDKYFCYTFHLRPDQWQPNGLINFGRNLDKKYQRRMNKNSNKIPISKFKFKYKTR